jgi:hypothetical protein
MATDTKAKTDAAKAAEDEQKRLAGQTSAGDASERAVQPVAGVVVSRGAGEAFSDKVTDGVDPRTGEQFEGGSPGLKGTHGEELLTGEARVVVAGVDPDRIPAEALPGRTPDAGGDELLAAAQAKAPSLTREFVDKMELNDETLAQIARGEIPPPPTPGPIHSSDFYRTPGGYQSVPPGVPPEDVGKNAVSR